MILEMIFEAALVKATGKIETIYEAKMTLQNKLTQYRDLQIELKPLLDQLKTLENEIKAEVLDTGQIPEVEGVKVQIRKGYTRSSWDNKMLRGYAVSHPEILDFVKETEVSQSVSIKVE